ncbi:MAG: ABC transporter permease [Actinomycetota bacterium]|nr:MAG: ABC transporter permease [Actinomycetota bacterium]
MTLTSAVTEQEQEAVETAQVTRRRRHPLLQYILWRIIRIAFVALLVTFVAFVLVALVPGDPAQRAGGEDATAEQLNAIRTAMGLDQSFASRYVGYLQGLLHGDLGSSVSLFRGESVVSIVAHAVPVTLSLAVVTMFLVILVGVPAGAVAAIWQGSVIDRFVTGFSTVALAVPAFVLGPILVLVFAVRLGWLPALGFVPLSDGFVPWLSHLLLPALALGFHLMAEVARQVRAAIVGELQESYIRTARAKGLKLRKIVGKHAMKNAGVAVITVVGLQFGVIVGGSVIVESIFNLPGLGHLAYNAVVRSDFPVIQAIVLLTALVVLLVNFIVDLSYLYFDPRLRRPAGA